MFNPIGSKPTVCTFAHIPGLILTGHESGKVALFDSKTGEEVNNNERAHMDIVTDLQLSPDRSYFITSSKDKTARLHDTRTLGVLKTYSTETPLNSAAIVSGKPYVLLGGGQDAMNVTMTSSRQGKFETRFWHKVFEEELGRVKGHFGPINTYVSSLSDLLFPSIWSSFLSVLALFPVWPSIRLGKATPQEARTGSSACTISTRATSRLSHTGTSRLKIKINWIPAVVLPLPSSSHSTRFTTTPTDLPTKVHHVPPTVSTYSLCFYQLCHPRCTLFV